jgi:hypothetical protein
MAITVKSIVDGVRARGAGTPPETITYLGLLLERHAMKRYGDAIYAQLHFPPGWLELKLTGDEFDEIVEVLVEVLDHHPRLASTAAFALGKAYSDLVVPRLICRFPATRDRPRRKSPASWGHLLARHMGPPHGVRRP